MRKGKKHWSLLVIFLKEPVQFQIHWEMLSRSKIWKKLRTNTSVNCSIAWISMKTKGQAKPGQNPKQSIMWNRKTSKRKRMTSSISCGRTSRERKRSLWWLWRTITRVRNITVTTLLSRVMIYWQGCTRKSSFTRSNWNDKNKWKIWHFWYNWQYFQ